MRREFRAEGNCEKDHDERRPANRQDEAYPGSTEGHQEAPHHHPLAEIQRFNRECREGTMTPIITSILAGTFFIWLDRPTTAHGWTVLGCATALVTTMVLAATRC
jgi:hypothetical protein